MKLDLKKALMILGVNWIVTVAENRIIYKNHRLYKSISSKMSKLDNQKPYNDDLPVFFCNSL